MSMCPYACHLLRSHLGLAAADRGMELEAFFGLQDTIEAARMRHRALGIYALYRIYNGLRHGEMHSDDIEGAFQAFVREGRPEDKI